MGFGLLFVGYLLAFGFTSGTNYIVSIIGVAGAVFLFAASRKLKIYSKHFRLAEPFSLLVGASYITNAVFQMIESDFTTETGFLLFDISRAFIILSVFLFNLAMYLGISQIALLAEDKKLATSSYTDLVIMLVYYVCVISAYIIGTPVKALLIAIPLLGLVWLVLSVWLVITSYMRICLPEDRNMDEKKKN